MIENRKKILLIALLIITLFINKKITYADATIGWGKYSKNTGTGSSSGSTTPSTPKPHVPGDGDLPMVSGNSGRYRYMCEYHNDFSPYTRITMNSYDITGKPLMNNNILVDNTFLSGTWIGLRTQEVKKVTWSVKKEADYYKAQKKYTCIFYKIKEVDGETCAEYNHYWQKDNVSCSYNYNTGTEKCECTGSASSSSPGTVPKPKPGKPSATLAGYYDATSKVAKSMALSCTHYRYKIGNCIKYEKETIEVTKSKDYTVEYNDSTDCPAKYKFDGDIYFYKSKGAETIEYVSVNPPEWFKNKCTNDSISNTINAAKNRIKNPTSELRILDFRTETSQKDNYPNSSSSVEGKLQSIKYEKEPQVEERMDTDTHYKGYVEQVYTFKPKNVCMNRITSVIRYIYEGAEGCNANEIDVTTGTSTVIEDGKYYKFWRYFIPINTLNGKSFYIKYEKTAGTKKLDEEECYSVIKNYPLENSYPYVILHKSREKFTGSRKIDIEKIKEEDGCYSIGGKKDISISACINIINTKPSVSDYTNYIRRVTGDAFVGNVETDENYIEKDRDPADGKKGGCIFSTKVSFDVEQKFYGQGDNYQSLKGYGIYFRQIDVNNPFPNGISEDSYWYGRYNSGKINTGNGEVALSNFKKITYIATISNKAVKTIKNFNKNNPYTKWVSDKTKKNGMNTNGTSDFIRNANTSFIFEIDGRASLPATSSFYNLGCGPLNKDWVGCNT